LFVNGTAGAELTVGVGNGMAAAPGNGTTDWIVVEGAGKVTAAGAAATGAAATGAGAALLKVAVAETLDSADASMEVGLVGTGTPSRTTLAMISSDLAMDSRFDSMDI
jgi:hypothetical protein